MIPEGTALNLCSVCYWHLATARGQGEEDCMASGATDSLADIIKFGLVKTQPLGDFQVGFVLLVPHQLLNHLHLSLCEKQLRGEERVLEDETSLPGFLNPLCKVSDGLRPSQTIAPHPIFRAIRRPGVHLSHPAGRSIKVLPRSLPPIIMTSSSSKTTSTMSVHASATSSHSSSEASVPKVASTPSYSHLPPSMYWKIASLNTATSAGDLRVVVTTLVSSLGHHLANISEVHPDPVPIISELEPSHLIDRGCGGVNALILDGRPPVLHLVGDLGEGPEPVELPLDHLPSAPGPKAPDPDFGGGVGLAIADLALELANVLPAQLYLCNGGHVKVLEPDEGEGVAGAWRGALDVDVHQFAISPENSSHLFICDVELEVASK